MVKLGTALVIVFALVVSGCSSTNTKELLGTLTLEISPPTQFGCSTNLYQQGTVSDGAGKIIGTITLVSLKSSRPTGVNFDDNMGLFTRIGRKLMPSVLCVYNLKSSPVNLNEDVLIIKFEEGLYLKGKWIRTKPEFADGKIFLELP